MSLGGGVRYVHSASKGPIYGSVVTLLSFIVALTWSKDVSHLREIFNSGWITYSEFHTRTGKQAVMHSAKHHKDAI